MREAIMQAGGKVMIRDTEAGTTESLKVIVEDDGTVKALTEKQFRDRRAQEQKVTSTKEA